MKTSIIAEIGINHNQSMENCHALIDAAARAGCDAVKIQLFRAASLYPQSAGNLDWNDGKKAYSYNIFKAVAGFETPEEWIEPLLRHCTELKMDLLASIFDERSLHLALRFGLPAIKLASSVVTNLPLLRSSAQSGAPLIMSVGGASLGEIEKALTAIKEGSGSRHAEKMLSLLHCSIQYPTALNDCNLGVLKTLALAFPGVRIGYSDHTEEPEIAPYQAVRLGARIVEKHITLDRAMPGPDHFFALEPEQLARMAAAIRRADAENAAGMDFEPDRALYGSTRVECTENQRYLRDFIYPTLFCRHTVKAGERLDPVNIEILRPGKKTRGLDAAYLPLLRDYTITAVRDIEEESSLAWDCVFVPTPAKKIALFRADAHPAVGTGDLVSFIHLSRILESQGWECRFCVRTTPEAEMILDSYGIANRHMLAANLPLEREVAVTEALAQRLQAVIVLVQVSDRPLEAYGSMRITGLKGCVCFEESAPAGFDLIWSWDVDALARYDQARHPETRFFLGPEYVILPPGFTEPLPPVLRKAKRENLLVVMGGGADKNDMTRAVAERLKAIGNPLHTTFILGGGYRRVEALEAALADAPFAWEIKRNVTNMHAEYLACDVCIAAGGLTASELTALQRPALLIALLEHQERRCCFFQKKGWAQYLGSVDAWRLELEDIIYGGGDTGETFRNLISSVVNFLITGRT